MPTPLWITINALISVMYIKAWARFMSRGILARVGRGERVAFRYGGLALMLSWIACILVALASW